MGWIGTALEVGGAGVGMYGQHEAERDAKRTTMFNVAQYERTAGQVQAAAQRNAEEMRRQARLLASRVQALAGGGGSDVSVVKTIGDISAEGEFRALSALFEGDSQASNLRERAQARQFEGDALSKASQFAQAGTIFRSGSSLYSKYGGGKSAGYSDSDGFVSNSSYQ